MQRRRFSKTVRLLKTSEFDRVMRQRTSDADGLIVLYAARGETSQTRLGLVVSRKCGNAVQRNRWKRLLRESFRLCVSELPTGLDLVVLPRTGATPHCERLQASFKSLVRRLDNRLTAGDSKR